jgi:cytochrome P450
MTAAHELVNDFDIFSDELAQHLPETLAYARRQCPVIHTEADGGYSVITRYEDVRQVLGDPKTFSSAWGVPRGKINPPIIVDPPDHRDYRMLLNRFFSYKALEPHEARIRALANRAIDVWVDRSEVEFVREFADPFTASVLGEVIFNDLEASEWTHQIQVKMEEESSRGDIEGAHDIGRQVARRKLEEERSSKEETRDSIVKAISNATVGGRPLSQEEQEGTLITLFAGGLDTTKATLSGILLHVARDPQLEDHVRNLHWTDPALDEFIRDLAPVLQFGRVVTRETSVGGRRFFPGDKILVHFWSANHDESVFENAGSLELERDAKLHVGFGFGIHRCIGSQLARIQIAMGLQELFRRITNVQLVKDAVTYSSGLARFPRSLELRFERR